MIKFFTRIWHKMLAENKFSRYPLYAIGEIVLSINNWDQNKLQKQEFSNYLLQINAELFLDIEYFNNEMNLKILIG
jgi:hypothetical protein